MATGALKPKLRIALPTTMTAVLANHVAAVMAVERLGSACEAQQDSGVSTTPALAAMAGAFAAMIRDNRNVVDAADDRASARGCKLDWL